MCHAEFWTEGPGRNHDPPNTGIGLALTNRVDRLFPGAPPFASGAEEEFPTLQSALSPTDLTPAWILLLSGGAVVAYAFVGYPLLLWGLTRLGAGRELPLDASNDRIPDAGLPRVSVTVPIYNEAHQLDEMLESLAALEYPADRLQRLVVSDGSDDGSDEIVARWKDRGIELLRVDERGGKGTAENAAREHLTGEIVVNSDASIRIRTDALRYLVRPFRDPEVGVVSGRDVSTGGENHDANSGEARYVGYEMAVRGLETRVGGIVGASGSLYATRRTLHDIEIPPGLSRDFASALVAKDRGYIAVSAPRAECLVPRTSALGREYRRKVRTVARGMTTLWAWRHLMNPVRHPLFAWKLISHKLARWFLPFALLAMVLALGLLSPHYTFASLTLGVAGVVGLIGVAGWWGGRRGRALPRVVALSAYCVLSNVAVLHALLRALRGRGQTVWEPTRRGSAQNTQPRRVS